MDLTPIQTIFQQIPLFILVMFRLGGLVVVAPLYSGTNIPFQVRLLFVLMLSFAIFPMVPKVSYNPATVLELAVGVGGELFIGLAMGFVVSLLFLGVQFGAEMISYQMGLSMAQLVDPMTEVNTTVLSQFYMLLATLIFVLLNGHLYLVKALIQTYQTIPLLNGIDSLPVVKLCTVVLTESFKLGIRICGPVLVALFLSTIALGFISRTMPQLNILAAGFPIRIVLSMVLMVASLTMVFALFRNSIEIVFEQISLLLRTV